MNILSFLYSPSSHLPYKLFAIFFVEVKRRIKKRKSMTSIKFVHLKKGTLGCVYNDRRFHETIPLKFLDKGVNKQNNTACS